MNILSGDMILKSINESMKIVSVKRLLKFPVILQSMHGDIVKGERESAYMFEIN